jgi:hypothetical protein
MKHTGFFILLIFLTISTNSILCQKNKSYFFARTVDEIYWKDTSYMCSISPLSILTGYESLYRERGICEISFGIPMAQDKNYAAYWTVIDGMLYLCDVKYICSSDSNYTPKRNGIEKFLKTKFSKKNLSKSDSEDERFKKGVIPAVWFSDTLYIKRFPRKDEYAWGRYFKKGKFFRLIFEKGRLTDEKIVSSMGK